MNKRLLKYRSAGGRDKDTKGGENVCSQTKAPEKHNYAFTSFESRVSGGGGGNNQRRQDMAGIKYNTARPMNFIIFGDVHLCMRRKGVGAFRQGAKGVNAASPAATFVLLREGLLVNGALST